MPLGIVTDSDFESELVNSEKPASRRVDIIPSPAKGRGEGNNEVPDSLRKVIGETGELDGRQEGLALAKSFGISPSSVSAYMNGANSTASYDETPNKQHINDAKERVSRKARSKLFSALKHMTQDKLSDTNAVGLATIARNMSGIIKELEPEKSVDDDKKGVTFVIFAPPVHREEHYDVIDAPVND